MTGFEWAIFVVCLIAGTILIHYYAYQDGVRDTEKRWAEAVAIKTEAHRCAYCGQTWTKHGNVGELCADCIPRVSKFLNAPYRVSEPKNLRLTFEDGTGITLADVTAYSCTNGFFKAYHDVEHGVTGGKRFRGMLSQWPNVVSVHTLEE